MSETLKKRLEKISEVLSRVAMESMKGVPIVVEGKADVEALRRLDVKGDLIAAKSGARSILDVLDEVERRGKREVVLLMDFDRRGREWTKRLAQRLEQVKMRPNTRLWSELSGLVRRDVKDVEGLPAYIETLKRKVGNRI